MGLVMLVEALAFHGYVWPHNWRLPQVSKLPILRIRFSLGLSFAAIVAYILMRESVCDIMVWQFSSDLCGAAPACP